MTRDEALKLDAGADLDAVVAEVIFGWKWVQPPKFDYDGHLPSQGMVLAPPGFDCDHFVWPNRGIVPPTYFTKGRKFSTDIAAAWQVLHTDHPCSWFDAYALIRYGGGYAIIRQRTGEVIAEADTAPLAICRAALKAVMKD